MTNVAFDPGNKGASLALTNVNLTATTSASSQGVFATSGQVSGKYYFEFTLGAGTVGLNTHYLGAALSSAQVSATSGLEAVKLVSASATTANVNVNGSTVVSAFTVPTMGPGTVVCCALDIDNQRAWFRVGATGNWNGNSGNDPTVPSTGVSLAALGVSGISFLPHIALINSGSALTANFGDSAFSGTVPTGFTSGFPTGGVNNALLTQIGIETWSGGAPSNAQITQIGAEVWRSVGNAIPVTTNSFAVMLS